MNSVLTVFNHKLGFRQWLRLIAQEYQFELTISALIVTAFMSLIVDNPAPFMVGIGSSVQDTFKHNRAKKNVIVAGGMILICITLLSCVSSFMIYREGFSDVPYGVQQALSLFAVIVVEGAFIWLVYGFTRAFSSLSERLMSLAGMAFIVSVMLMNIITHFMMVKKLALSPFQEVWLAWGAVSVFIAVLVLILLITLSDPQTKLMRLEMRYTGKQQEVILSAKSEGLESDRIREAMGERAEWEADQLADKILGNARQVGYGSAAVRTPQSQGAFRRPPSPTRRKN